MQEGEWKRVSHPRQKREKGDSNQGQPSADWHAAAEVSFEVETRAGKDDCGQEREDRQEE